MFLAVRQKVKELIDFVKDDERLHDERKKAKKNKNKYVGMSGLSASLHYGRTWSPLHSITHSTALVIKYCYMM